jgi:hypothetical protein
MASDALIPMAAKMLSALSFSSGSIRALIVAVFAMVSPI